jgi:hypothetical protein
MFTHIPYAEHVSGIEDHTIRCLYERTFDEGIGDTLFNDGSIQNAEEFLKSMKSPGTCFFIVVRNVDRAAVGFWWLNRLTKTHAWCHFVAFKEMWGTEHTVPIGKEAMRICCWRESMTGL